MHSYEMKLEIFFNFEDIEIDEMIMASFSHV